MCYFKNLHKGHKLVELFDEEELKKENITLESELNYFNDISQKMKELKNKIENEITKINQLFDNTIDELQKSYQKKYEILLKEENELKEDLQNKVTKVKEQLEINISEINYNIRINERINTGLKKLEKGKSSIIQILSYVSKLNISKRNMKKLENEFIKSIKFRYIEEKNKINYEDFYINGMLIPKDIQFKEIKSTSLNIFWKIDNDINLINIDKNKIKYKVEIRKINDNFKEVYQGNNTNCFIDNLMNSTTYEVRICCLYKNMIGEWSQPATFETDFIESIILKETNKQKEYINKILKWSNYSKMVLIYRGTRDGMTSNDFHNKCDNQGPTISLFKNEKNHIFGGYASISWTSDNENKNAPNSFLFSLTNIYNTEPTKFPSINDGKEVYHEKDYGPIFGDSGIDLYIHFNHSEKNNAYSKFPKSYRDVLGHGKYIFTSDENNFYFRIKEIEVFKLFK